MDLFDTEKHRPPFDLPSGDGYAVQWLAELQGYKVSVPRGELLYIEQFFNKKTSDRVLEYFQENDTVDWRCAKWADMTAEALSKIQFKHIKWKQDSIRLYGKIIPLPRLTSWYGDSGKSYTYSGITSHPHEWNECLSYLKNKIEQCSGVTFNSVLLNWYRDGEDYLNWHADDEKELGKNPIIASANFGETRDFVIRRNENEAEKIKLPLKHGTLLVMQGELQHFWQHAVPKRKKVAGSRFNLTFRRINFAE